MMRPDFIPQDEWTYIVDYAAERFRRDYSVHRFEKGSDISNEIVLEKNFVSDFDWIFGLTLKLDGLKKLILSEFRKKDFFREVPTKFSGLTYQITNQANLYVEKRKQNPSSCLYESPENKHDIVVTGFFNIIEKYTDDLIPQKFELVRSVSGISFESGENEPNSPQIASTIAKIPAADRYVEVNDNDPELNKVREKIDVAYETIRGFNESTNYDRDQIVRDLDFGRRIFELFKNSKVRVGAVIATILAPLYTVYHDIAAERIRPVVEVAINAVKIWLGL